MSAMTGYTELAPIDFSRQIAEAPGAAVLLDVRTANELQLARLPLAIHIPLDELPGRIHELNPDRSTVVMCHGGVRSAMAADFLAANGFTKVFNLTGGIDRWSREVDASVPRY